METAHNFTGFLVSSWVLREAVTYYDCPFCKAQRGEPCHDIDHKYDMKTETYVAVDTLLPPHTDRTARITIIPLTEKVEQSQIGRE